MTRVRSTALGVLVALPLVLAGALGACSNGGAREARTASSAATNGAPADSPPVVLRCGVPVEAERALSDDLRALREAFVTESDLAPAPAYEGHVAVCDNLGSSSAEVPSEWDDVLPGPGEPPQSVLTVGPELDTTVEVAPVAGVGVLRFVGEPDPVAVINENNARGSLENGTRTLPRRGDSVFDGCTPREPRPYAHGGFTGETQAFVDCDGERRAWLMMAAYPDGGEQFQIQMIGQALDTADAEALVRVLATVRVDQSHLPGMTLPPLPPPVPLAGSDR